MLLKKKKLKIKSLLHLHSAVGSVPVRVFLSESSEAGTELCQNAIFVENFPFNAIALDETTLPVLIYIGGYAAKKKMKGHLQM